MSSDDAMPGARPGSVACTSVESRPAPQVRDASSMRRPAARVTSHMMLIA